MAPPDLYRGGAGGNNPVKQRVWADCLITVGRTSTSFLFLFYVGGGVALR